VEDAQTSLIDDASKTDLAKAPQRSQGLSASLTTLIKFGGAATAIGLLIGWLYQQGLMDGMELPAVMFPTKLEDLLFMTYLVALSLSNAAWKVFGEHLILLSLGSILFGIAVGLLISLSFLIEDHLSLRGWATRVLQRAAKSRYALGVAVGVGSGVGTVATLVAVGTAASFMVVLPLAAYTAGKEEGVRVRSTTECTNASGPLLTKCAEAVFEDGERVVGVYLAGTSGALALRVGGNSVVYMRPVRTIRFGAEPRKK
jgi:hypothetical protein